MLTGRDLAFLKRVIEIALAARSQGNHPFGALLVGKDGKALLESGNTTVTNRDPTAHAELNLVRTAAQQFTYRELVDCTIYCSTEPCAMCAGAIHWSGIGRVVYALSQERLYRITCEASEDKPLRLPCRDIFSKCERKIEVEGPALEEEAAMAHQGYWK